MGNVTISSDEAAKRIGIKLSTLDKLINQNHLPHNDDGTLNECDVNYFANKHKNKGNLSSYCDELVKFACNEPS